MFTKSFKKRNNLVIKIQKSKSTKELKDFQQNASEYEKICKYKLTIKVIRVGNKTYP